MCRAAPCRRRVLRPRAQYMGYSGPQPRSGSQTLTVGVAGGGHAAGGVGQVGRVGEGALMARLRRWAACPRAQSTPDGLCGPQGAALSVTAGRRPAG